MPKYRSGAEARLLADVFGARAVKALAFEHARRCGKDLLVPLLVMQIVSCARHGF